MSSIDDARAEVGALPPGPDRVLALNTLASLLLDAGDLPAALEAATEALTGAREIGNVAELNVAMHIRVATLIKLGHDEEARPEAWECVRHTREHQDVPIRAELFVRNATSLLGLLDRAGQLDQAADLSAETVRAWRVSADPELGRDVLGNHAAVLRNKGDNAGLATTLADLADMLRPVTADLGTAAGPSATTELIRTLDELASIRLVLGEPDAAVASIDEAVMLARALPAAQRLPSLTNRVVILDRAGQDATEACAQLIGLLRGVDPAAVPDRACRLADALAVAGRIAALAGREGEAVAPFVESLELRGPLAEADPRTHLLTLSEAYQNLTNALGQQGRYEEALEVTQGRIETVRRLAERVPDPGRALLVDALVEQVTLLETVERTAQAEPFAIEAVALARALGPAGRPRLAYALGLLADTLDGTVRQADQIVAFREAVALYRDIAEPDFTSYSLVANSLAFGLTQTGQTEEALAVTAEAVTAGRRGTRDALAIALWTFAETRLAFRTDLAAARRAINESIALYETSGTVAQLVDTQQMRADIEAALIAAG